MGAKVGVPRAKHGSVGFDFSHLEKTRKQLEDKLVPQVPRAHSTSDDEFEFETPISSPLEVGFFVEITTQAGGRYFGQILTQQHYLKDGPEYGMSLSADAGVAFVSTKSSAILTDRIKIRHIVGTGRILREIRDGLFVKPDRRSIFQDAEIRLASSEKIRVYLSHDTDTYFMEVGCLQENDAQVYLRASGFDRHTFLCGQSGSGKTFALGVLLEQLLLHTSIPIVVLDPNSDFIRLNEELKISDTNRIRSQDLSADQYDSIMEKFRAAKKDLNIFRHPKNKTAAELALQIHLSDLEQNEQAALLRLDPLDDREEYYSFYNMVKRIESEKYSLAEIKQAVLDDLSPSAQQIGLRVSNLGVENWSIWSEPNEMGVIENLPADKGFAILDLGDVDHPRERWSLAISVLGHYWRRRHSRNPVIIVIDEAHNICPAHPSDDVEKISTDYVVQIAGEGRKFGLYLLLATQRPDKLHPNVISQCDNLMLMKMNSQSDLRTIEQYFSFVPPSFLQRSIGFKVGEAIVAGKFSLGPTFLKVGGRLSPEGGADVPAAWADEVRNNSRQKGGN